MAKLNATRKKLFGDSTTDLTKFANLSIGQTSAIAEKLTNTLALTGEDISTLYEEASKAAGDDAGLLANYMSSINFADASMQDKIRAELEAMGLEWTSAVEKFVNAAFEASNAIKVVNFETLNQDLKDVYDLIQSIRMGE
jgi:hypothetical protein